MRLHAALSSSGTGRQGGLAEGFQLRPQPEKIRVHLPRQTYHLTDFAGGEGVDGLVLEVGEDRQVGPITSH
jgi:hypothetical protein